LEEFVFKVKKEKEILIEELEKVKERMR